MTFFQLEDLLSQEGYENKHQPDIKTPGMWFRSIGARLLPHLLSREVWEGIQATPPEKFIIQYPRSSAYVRERTRHVVLHNIYKTFANGAEMFSPDWSLLLKIWHESTAQLISDEVPQERILPSGGVYHVLQIWKMKGKKSLRTETSPDGYMTQHLIRTKILP